MVVWDGYISPIPEIKQKKLTNKKLPQIPELILVYSRISG